MADTRVSVIGCGAVGSIIAAHLARLAHADVWLYGTDAAHIAAVQAAGLRVSGAADFTAQLSVTANAAEIPRCDFSIVAVEAAGLRETIAAVAHAFDERTGVCVLGGADSAAMAAEYAKWVMRGETGITGRLAEPGRVILDDVGKTQLAPFTPSGVPMITVAAVADMLTRAGLPAGFANG